jgi:hypothetical protein
VVGGICFASAILYLLAKPPVRKSPRVEAAPVQAT